MCVGGGGGRLTQAPNRVSRSGAFVCEQHLRSRRHGRELSKLPFEGWGENLGGGGGHEVVSRRSTGAKKGGHAKPIIRSRSSVAVETVVPTHTRHVVSRTVVSNVSIVCCRGSSYKAL